MSTLWAGVVAMKTLIYVTGPSSAGKDEIAEYIARDYYFTHIKISDIAKKFVAEKNCSFLSLKENLDFYKYIADKIMKTERAVVSGMREPKMLELGNREFLGIFCECDKLIRERRYSLRPDPKPTFQEKESLDQDLGLEYTRKKLREKMFVEKECLWLDTSNPLDITLQEVDQFLMMKLFDLNAPVINPFVTFLTKRVAPLTLKQVQPNGVELTVGEVYRIDGELTISETRKEMANRQKLEPNEQGFFVLEYDQAYEVIVNETVSVPPNYLGIPFSRSTFL
ncbi:MAG: hypothetical protein AAB875_00140, partial [Patescibacteria group bacterium]